ncbi:MAG: 30S ribosomal protein S9 [Streptosporangiaceae bacterium]
MAESTEVETPVEGQELADSQEEHAADYTTETPEVAETPQGPAPSGPVTGTGRRKAAVARVRVMPGSGEWKVNGQPLEVYFANRVHQQLIKEPLTTLRLDDKFDVVVRVSGGGVSGQAGALRLGLARALSDLDPEGNRPVLKKARFLTRDARVKERRKYGLKKARKAPQYSKR